MRRAAVFGLLWLLILSLVLVPAVALAGSTHTARASATHISTTTYNTNTTWTTGGSPYILDGTVTVASGVTLTINPGVIVKFNGQLRELVVDGTLSAVGSSGNEIVFTSYKDDTVGGDSNGDASATSPAAGDWYHISISAGTGSELRHVKIHYGGWGSADASYGAIAVSGSSTQVAVGNAEITHNQRSGIYVQSGAGVTVSASEISHNANGISVNQGWVKVKQRTFITDNSADGLNFSLTSGYTGTTSAITDSDVSGNAGRGIFISAYGLTASKQPYGNRSNIYDNGPSTTDGKQLVTTQRNWGVDWTGNYWGPDVYFWRAAGVCQGTTDETYGHLSYRWSAPAPTAGLPTPPDGPIAHGNYVGSSGGTVAFCPRDDYRIFQTEYSPAYIGGAQPSLADGQALSCGGNPNNRPNLNVCSEDPVNSATGNFAHEVTDVSLPGVGVTFDFTRFYNSLDSAIGTMGQGWTNSQAASLTIKASGDVVFEDGDGQRFLYALDGSSFTPPPGALSELASVTGGYELTRPDQVVYHFDTNGRLTSLKDRNNKGLTYAYSSGRLATVTDAAGRDITFTYTSGKLTQISVPDGRSVSYGYTSGRLTSVTDVRGKVWTYTYEAHGLLEKETDPLSHVVFTNTYGIDGRVASQKDALNHETDFAWDYTTGTQTVTDARSHTWKDVYEGNVLQSRVDALNNETTFAHNDSLDETGVTGPDDTTVDMTYDADGNLLTASVDALDATKTYTYDGDNNVTSVTDARGIVTTYAYDGSGNNTSITQDGTTVATYTYNASGQPLTLTDALSNETTYTYDSDGNLASETDPLGNETTYDYGAAGNMTSKVMPRGNVGGADPEDFEWTYTYNASGQALTETDPLSHTTTHAYDDSGNETTVTDARSKTTTTAYDAANRVSSVTAADTGVTSYTYDAVGNKVTQVDPRSKTTTFAYNADNRLVSQTTPLGGETTYFYDAAGNLTKQVEPRGNTGGADPDDYATLYTYDDAGRLLTEADPLDNTTAHTYDEVGNETSVTDANDHTTAYEFDGLGRLTSVTAPDDAETTYTYDDNGNVLTRTDDNGHVTSYTYDDANQLTEKTLPLARTWTYAYDEDGNETEVVDANGNATMTAGDGKTTNTYDDADRLTAIDYSDSTPDVTFTYDAVGNRTQMTDGGGTQTATFDDVNRVASVTRGSDVFSYVYDLAGNVAERTYPDSTVVNYTYDNDERLASVTSASQTTSYAYDASGNLTETTLPSGNGYVRERTYDRASRLTEVNNVKSGTSLADFTYTLDPVGNPTEVVRVGNLPETETFGYDEQDRLTDVCFQSSCPGGSDPFIRYSYDGVGNRLTEERPAGTTEYDYNAADELIEAGATSYDYDDNGNETEAGSRTLSYDLANRLASTASGGTTTTYAYDGDGNRRQQSIGGTVTKFLWDTNHGLPQLALERDGSNALLRRYVYGQRRISVTTGGNTYYYLTDNLGSVANLTSASGTSQWTYSYEPFGKARTAQQDDGSAPANPMRFTGELLDASGLYYLQARQYDSAIGRFAGPDPAACPFGSPSGSAYAYVESRPTFMVDPSGRTPVACNEAQAIAALSSHAGGGEESDPPREQLFACTTKSETPMRNCRQPLRGAELRNARTIWTLARAAGIPAQRAREMVAAACQESSLIANKRNPGTGAGGLFQLTGSFITRANRLGGIYDARANTCSILWNYKAFWKVYPSADPGVGAKLVENSGAAVSFYTAPLATLRRSFTPIAVQPCPQQKPICAGYFTTTRFAFPGCSING